MFGLSISELVVVLVIALLLFGPKKLPEIARKLGQVGREIKNTCNVFKEELDRPDNCPTKDNSNNHHPQNLQG